MTSPLYNQVEQAFAELERKRAALARVQRDLANTSTTATSKNRAVSVTVNSRGDITELKFVTGAYRAMAPTELAQLIVDTIAAARTESMTNSAQMFRDLLPENTPLLDMLDGKVDLDSLFDRAVRQAQEPLPGAGRRRESR